MIYNERKILVTLRRHLNGHKYQLFNTYIFDWESDYFGVTTSNYVYEIEVKISRGDFKADAKKVSKYNAIKNTLDKKKVFAQRGQTCYEYDYPETTYERRSYKRIPTGNFRVCKAWTGGSISKRHKDMNPRYLYSEIHIRNVPRVPNKFYYCVPEGLIKIHEIPSYAGLMYINNNSIRVVKQAPFIHKIKLDLTKTLLEKFYFRSLKLEANQTELMI